MADNVSGEMAPLTMGDLPAVGRPLPDLTVADTQPFWEATSKGDLMLQRCASCGQVVFYPRAHCPHCGTPKPRWERSAGRGSVYSFTVVRQHPLPFFKARLPYVVALVDLDEGFRMLTNLIVDDVAAVGVGDRVRLRWEQHDQLSIPLFELDEPTERQ